MPYWTIKSNWNYINVKIKGLKKWDDKVYFEIVDQWEIHQWNYIEGYFSKIVKWSFEFEWKTIETFAIHLKDTQTDSIIVLNMSYNSISRSIINCLASIPKLNLIRIQLYINKDWYKAVFLQNDWEKLSWKYQIEEMNQHIETITKKNWEKIVDYTELDNRFKETIEQINISNFPTDEEQLDAIINQTTSAEEKSKPEESKKEQLSKKSKAKSLLDGDDELPF